MSKKNLTEAVLKYLNVTTPSSLNESREENYKSSRYGNISIISRTGDAVNIGKVNFKDVEKMLDSYIKPKNNGVYKSVTITVGRDRKRNKNGVVYIHIHLDDASYKDLASMSGVSEKEVKDSGYPEDGFGLRVKANPYIADPDTKPNGFQFVSKDRNTELKYRARYDVGKLSDKQKLIKSKIFANVRNAAYTLSDVLDGSIN